jgi:uncharacterized membrane protein YphA (DoxX/SURF4 family)
MNECYTVFMILSTFPLLLNYHFLAPALIRLTASLFFLIDGYKSLAWKKKVGWVALSLALLELLSGALLFIGLFTQVSTVILIILVAVSMFKKTVPIADRELLTKILLLAILASLLFSGPGSLAFDLPL